MVEILVISGSFSRFKVHEVQEPIQKVLLSTIFSIQGNLDLTELLCIGRVSLCTPFIY